MGERRDGGGNIRERRYGDSDLRGGNSNSEVAVTVSVWVWAFVFGTTFRVDCVGDLRGLGEGSGAGFSNHVPCS